MEITEVRVKLVEGKQDKLKAFCSITIEDSFVIRDLKIIEGSKGLFVAMPSRRLTVRCSKCGSKNQIRSNFCCECGYAMPEDKGARTRNGRLKLHADIAHPINSKCREEIQNRVLETFAEEIDASGEPDYEPTTFDDLEDPLGEEFSFEGARPRRAATESPRRGRETPAVAVENSTSRDTPRERQSTRDREPTRGSGRDRPRQPREKSREKVQADRPRSRRGSNGDAEHTRSRSTQRPDRRDAGRRPESPVRERREIPRQEEEPLDDNFGAGLF